MKLRNLFVGIAGLLLIALVAVQWTGPSVAALETQVADQETRISNHGREIERLEDRVATLEAGTQPEGTGDSESVSAPAGDSATVSGVGVMVSDKFNLEPGRYKVSATVEVADFDGFIVHLIGSAGDDEYLFNEIIDTPGTWTGSTIVDVRGGEYAVEVENTSSAWTLVFEKF